MPEDVLSSLMSKARKKKGLDSEKQRESESKEQKPFDALAEKMALIKKAGGKEQLDSFSKEKPVEDSHAVQPEKDSKPSGEKKTDAKVDAEVDVDKKLASVLKSVPQKSIQSIPPEAEALKEAPSNFVSQSEKELTASKKKNILETYGEVKIFSVPDKPLLYYFIPTPRPSSSERAIINTLKEAATRLITFSPYRIRDIQQRKNVYKQKVIEIIENAPELKIPTGKEKFYADIVVREMVGYGLIDPLVNDDNLEDIMIIGEKSPVYVFHRKYGMLKTNIEFFSNGEINDLINRIAREVGRRVDIGTPLMDARLGDGSRANATINPASISGSTLTFRKFRKDPLSIIDLIVNNTMDLDSAAFLWVASEGLGAKPANILISGGTGSGKTTLLNVLTSFVPKRERVITIEDTAELSLPLEHWIRLEGRPPGLEGRGEITLDVLTKNSLRMRPDRIIVGEVRHAEAFTLFTAMNTGHDGCMGTLHANTAAETIVRIINPPMNVPVAMISGLDLIIVEHRIHDRRKGTIRRVIEIAEYSKIDKDNPETRSLFVWDAAKDRLERTGFESDYLKRLSRLSGLSMRDILNEVERRKDFLKKLLGKNIREIEKVSTEAEKFLLSGR